MEKSDKSSKVDLEATVTQQSLHQGQLESISKTHLPEGRDDAFELFDGRPEDFVYSAREANKVRWKLDLILLPMMAGTYILNYMDKVALSEASVFGIREDLHLVGSQYQWASSIFYLGYIVWQYPSSILMQKLPIGRYFGTMILLWGVTTTTTAATTNFATLATARVFLGFFETCMSPILTILVGQYWTRDEHPLRTAIWWSGSATGGFIADAITYGVSGKSFNKSKYEVWQIIYFVFGPITITWGILTMLIVPTSPMKAWFFTGREKKIAVARVVSNQTGVENRQYKWYQVRECLIDPQPWLLALNAFLQCLQGGGLTSFSKIVLTGMGYTSRQSTLMAMPSNAIHLVSVIACGYFCSRVKNTRIYTMIAMNLIVLVGAILVDTLPDSSSGARLGAFYMIYVNTVPFGLGMSMMSSNIGGFTKKATASVMYFIGYCVGQFSGPFFFKTSEDPRYPTAFRAFYCSVSLMIVIELLLLAWVTIQNRRRDARDATLASQETHSSDLLDLTDWETRDFRYIW